MSKKLFGKTKKAITTASFHISGYEKGIILERLGRAVEKLKEARKEIRQTVQLILRLKETGDCMADQALAAVAALYLRQGNPWVISTSTKKDMKREAAKPLLLMRAD